MGPKGRERGATEIGKNHHQVLIRPHYRRKAWQGLPVFIINLGSSVDEHTNLEPQERYKHEQEADSEQEALPDPAEEKHPSITAGRAGKPTRLSPRF